MTFNKKRGRRSLATSAQSMLRVLAGVSIMLVGAHHVSAHPHAFVDGGVDFVLTQQDGQPVLSALHVTWLLDEFETLYMLSAAEIGLNQDGNLSEPDRSAFVKQMHEWLGSFAGSTHVSVGSESKPLRRAENIVVDIVEGRLKITFDRAFASPVKVVGEKIDVGFYEQTYFYAYSVTQSARVRGAEAQCETQTIPFNDELPALQASLRKLGREEVPEDTDVGRLFADWIVLQCA